MMSRTIALIFIWPMLCAGAAQAACVTNSTDDPLLFTIDASAQHTRKIGTVAPGGTLCLTETAGAIFHVFASGEELEGCSRIAGPGGNDDLLEFHRYDNCRWASHGK